ncbi:MAG TPA: hypothetical protein VFU30_10575 [Gaiellaceae bacterium]|nr:hypothetical protein [Gaiellaceae bacterium]
MKTKRRYGTAVLGTLFGATILSGVALAGNPHGTPPGQAKGQVNASVSTSSAAGNSVGVKSSATTHFNTQAAANSSGTKAYGNGSTAGQIAIKNGAGQTATLYGPGNSQPHKTLCPSGKHMVDVHALKAHGGSCAAGTSESTTPSTPTSPSTSTSTSGSVGTSTSGTGVAGTAHAGAPGNAKGGNGAFTPPSSNRNGGVLGSSVSMRARPARPVLGAANFTG